MSTVPLISADALKTVLGQPGLVILDATALLPGDSFDPDAAFHAARIPGAARFEIERFSDQETSLPHMAPTPGRFASLFAALGCTQESQVVFYDQKGVASACRGWWLTRLFGHRDVRVLDGGLPAWHAAAGPIDSEAPHPPAPGAWRPFPHFARVKGLGDMIAHVAGNSATILDARSHARFTGSAPEPRPGVRSGHMPGAASVPYPTVLDETNRFLPAQTLRALFEAAGVRAERPVITSCGSGMTAAVLSLALEFAGFTHGALYDGSWAEWGATPEAPVSTGEAA